MRGSVAGLSTIVSALLLAAPAAAADPACGDTVTHNVKLHADMDCSATSSNGIIIGKNGLTIDLNGHTITGPNTTSYYGVDGTGGFDKITVKNGTVKDFEEGVYFDYTTGSHIDHIKSVVTSGGYPLDIEYSQQSSITHSVADGPADDGIYLYYNNAVKVSDTKVKNGDPLGESGVYDYYSRSTLTNVTSTGSEYGIYLEAPYRGYKVLKSHANENSYAGIYVSGNYPTNVSQARVEQNTANNNGDYGIYAEVRLDGKKKNHAQGNGTQNCYHAKC